MAAFGQTAQTVFLKGGVDNDALEDVHITSFDQTLTSVKQLKGSIEMIEDYVLREPEKVSIYPRRTESEQSPVRDLLERRINELRSKGLAYLSPNLATHVNIKTRPKPNGSLVDVFLLQNDSPAAVFCICDEKNDNVKRYNIAVASRVTQAILGFTQEPFSVVYGLMDTGDLTTNESFSSAFNLMISETSPLSIPGTLSMTIRKYKSVVRAFLSSIASTCISVAGPGGDTETGKELWFLPLEQFRVLTENVDHPFVRIVNSSGDPKALLLEVAKRLEKIGKTLLVVKSLDVAELARQMSICSFVLTLDEYKVLEDRVAEGAQNVVTMVQDQRLEELSKRGKFWHFVMAEEQSRTLFEIEEEMSTHAVNIENQVKSEFHEIRKKVDETEMSLLTEIHQIQKENKEMLESKRQAMLDLGEQSASNYHVYTEMDAAGPIYNDDGQTPKTITLKQIEISHNADALNKMLTSAITKNVYTTTWDVMVKKEEELHFSHEVSIDESMGEVSDMAAMQINNCSVIILTSSSRNTVYCIDQTSGKTKSRLGLDHKPWSVTSLSQDTIAVSLPVKKVIVFVKVAPDFSLQELARVKTMKLCYGLAALSPMSMVAGTTHKDHLDILDMSGQIQQSLPAKSELFIKPWFLCVDNRSNIIVSDHITKTVSCLTTAGEIVFTYSPSDEKALQCPKCVKVNERGSIFVKDDKKIVELTCAGEFVRDILIENNISAMCFNKDGKMFVCTEKDTIIVYH